MQKLFLISFAFFWAAPVLAAEEIIFAPPGDWVSEQSIDLERTISNKDAAAVLLGMDQQLRFNKDDDEFFFGTKILVQTPQGLHAMGTISIPWSPDTSTLIVHRLHILRGKEVIDVLGNGQTFTILRREANLESAALDGVLTAAIQPEDMQVGDIVDMAFTLRVVDPVLKGHSETTVAFPNNSPDTAFSLRAFWDDGSNMRWQKSDSLPEPKVTSQKALTRLSQTLPGTSNLIHPKGAPARYAPVRVIEFTDYGAWNEISALMAPLYIDAAQIPADSSLMAEVDKIREAGSDPKVRAQSALKLVQDRVRYVYRGMNTGNLVPANAVTTWKRKFGDCKGKTALLIAILAELGIDAVPAAVSSSEGDGLDQKLPLVGHLDHILVRAEIAGRTYWLDGTRQGDFNIDNIEVPPFHWALPVMVDGAPLEPLIQQPFEKPSEFTDIWIDASAGKSMPAVVEVKKILRGDEAVASKTVLEQLSAEDLDKALRSYWERKYDFIEPSDFGSHFDPVSGEYRLTVSGTAKLDWGWRGYQLDGARIGWVAEYEREDGPNMDAPVTVPFPYFVAHKQTIILPHDGVGFSVVGEDVDKTAGSYAFKRVTRISGDELVMESSQRSLAGEMPWAEAVAEAEHITALSKVLVYVKHPFNYRLTPSEIAALDEKKPASAMEYNSRGNDYLDIREYDKAIADFTKAVELDPAHAYAWANRGITYAHMKNVAAANADLNRAEEIDPRVEVIFHGRAVLAMAANDIPSAVAALTRAIDMKDKNSWALEQRVNLNFFRGDYDSAMADAKTLLDYDPTSFTGAYFKAKTLSQTERYQEALSYLDSNEPKISNEMDFQLMRAEIHVQMADFEAARESYGLIRSNADGNSRQFNALCWSLATVNFDLETALHDCDAALKLEPGEPAYLDSKAMVLLRMGRYQEAIEMYDQALKKSADFAVSQYGRGLAKIKSGDLAGGQADLKAAERLHPGISAEYKHMGLDWP
tara:strand:+ start:7706 stop:10648 length:2943 start_codon:yes stop_codon:yes gene_type:complete